MKHFLRARKPKASRGSLTIEATVTLPLFIIVILAVLNFMNYCRIQAMMSSAVDTVAKEFSQYCYLYEMTGLRRLENKMTEAGKSSEGTLNTVIGSMDAMFGAFENGKTSASAVTDSIKAGDVQGVMDNLQGFEGTATEIAAQYDIISGEAAAIAADPGAFMKSFAALAGSKVTNYAKSQLIAAPLAKALVVKHFGDNAAQASAKLESLGVVDGLDGLNFRLSTLFSPTSPDDVEIVCFYKIKVINPFAENGEDEMVLSKVARTRGWLGGDDPDRVTPKKEEEPKTEEEEEEEKEEEFSIWQIAPSAARGEYITSQEKKMAQSQGAYSASKYYDSYYNTNGQNKFVQYVSIDTFSQTYSNDVNAAANSLFNKLSKLDTNTSALKEEITVTDPSGNKTTVNSPKGTRTIELVVILPDNTSAQYEADLKARMAEKTEGFGDNYTITYVHGYGDSPIPGAAAEGGE